MKLLANGIEIHYELAGTESAPVVRFSHSLLANLAMWDPQMDSFDNYRVLRFDTRGHGQSEATPGAYDFELLADDAKALFDVPGIRKTHFAGLSMGGMIGQELALKYPERLESLIFVRHARLPNRRRKETRHGSADRSGNPPITIRRGYATISLMFMVNR
ncbi:MAG: alpha/beta hydrolase [Proteobacteria bacterium]|nr:alpha/beta hydrolase [Pseudomonadota bacterium]